MAGTTVEFPPELVETIWSDVRGTDSNQFRLDELKIIENNAPIDRLRADVYEVTINQKGKEAADSYLMGYLLGHRVLRSAYGQATLPPRSPQLIAGYRKAIAVESGRLTRDFIRDYEGHEAVIDLVTNKMRMPSAQYGAKLIFALYGRLANPDRPLVHIALQEVSSMKPSRQRARQLHQQTSSRHQAAR